MARVTPQEVSNITNVDAGSLSLIMAIDTAALIVDELIESKVSEGLKNKIELYLAAHFTELSNGQGPLAGEDIGSAKERYHNIYSAGLGATRFGQQAVLLDTSGSLAAMTEKILNPARKTALFETVTTKNPWV